MALCRREQAPAPSSPGLAWTVTLGPAAGAERKGGDADSQLGDSTPTPGDGDQMAKPCPKTTQRSQPERASPLEASEFAMWGSCFQPGA